MRIGIDISQIVFRGTGVATYTKNLVDSLLEIDKENEYVLFGSSLRLKHFLDNYHTTYSSQSEAKFYQIPPSVFEFLWNRLHVVPIERFTGKLDVFHTSDWLEPPARCPKVTTIHDLAVFKYPESFTPFGGHDIVQNLKRKLKWVKKESDLVITVSQNSKKDIVEILEIPQEKIRVVYEACDAEFVQKSDESVERIKKKYGIKGDYILAVGTREPRKNLERVIEAFSAVSGQGLAVSLVIAGKFGWGRDIENLKFKIKNLKLLGYVPHDELPALYSGARVFVYPSLYEGFGLPVLEAMNCGCPVVTSNVSSLPEVAGDAAVLVNPESVEEIAQGIKMMIDKKMRDAWIRKGFKRAKEFSWRRAAKETLAVYEELNK